MDKSQSSTQKPERHPAEKGEAVGLRYFLPEQGMSVDAETAEEAVERAAEKRREGDVSV